MSRGARFSCAGRPALRDRGRQRSQARRPFEEIQLLSLRFKKSALAAAIIAPIALFASAAGAADAAAAPATLKAGTYTMTTPGNNGMVEVTVELTENAIKSVKIGKNVETEYIAKEPMESVAAEIVRTQNLAVDMVSGATQSTGAILTAVGLAIEKAGGRSSDYTHPYVPIDPATLPLADAPATQVLVIGAGATGLAAAAAAADNGAKVIVLEKMPEIGGSTALSKGWVLAAGTKEQAAAGIKDDAKQFAAAWLDEQKRSVKGGLKFYPEKARVEAMAAESAETVAWLEEKAGLKFNKPVVTDLTGTARAHGTADASGRTEIEALGDFCEKKGVAIRTNTTAYELIQGKDGRITGVRAHDGKNRYEFKADAVVLATGGFAQNLERIAAEIPRWAIYTEYSMAAKGSTGDGIVMAEKAGAAPAKDSWMIGLSLKPVYKALEQVIRTDDGFKRELIVNERGERFVREDLPFLADAASEQRTSWFVFDSSDKARTKIVGDYLTFDVAVHGKDIRELARRMGVNADRLEAQVKKFNEDCKKGVDSAFGKDPKYLRAVEKAPFYAVQVRPASGGTMGGVQTNDKFQVLDRKGGVIQGLYAGGAMANRPYYDRYYLAGSSLTIAYTSGRLIGEEAAKAVLKK